MKKSLLEILEEEKSLIDKLNFNKSSVESIRKECQDSEDASIFYRLSERYYNEIKNMEESLKSVRLELKEYIDFLENLY